MDNQGMNKMAKTTSSSSSMVEDDDRISKLPDPLIIHILSSLPTEQVVRTCILSKRWKHIWYSVPTLFFSNNITNISTHRTAKNEVVRKQGRDKFYSCVEKYLEHRKKGMNSIVDSVILTSFTLKMKGYYQTSKADVLDKWLAFAVENKVKEMYLWIDRDEACDGEDMYDYVFYCLPKIIESARYLTDLELNGVELDTSNFDFPSLKALSLVYVRSSCAVKNGEAFKFLLGCPSLEKLRLHKYYFKRVSSFTEDEVRLESLSLKFLELRDTRYRKLEVEAMNLESLVLIGVTEYEIDISACKKIRNLSLDDNGRNFNLSLHDLISSSPLLENLTLNFCYNYNNNFKISGQNLKSFIFKNCCLNKKRMKSKIKVTIESTPKLEYFYYEGHIDLNMSIEPSNSLNGKIVLFEKDHHVYEGYDAVWFTDLLNFLLNLNCSWNTVSLHAKNFESLTWPEKLKKVCRSPLLKWKHLKVNIEYGYAFGVSRKKILALKDSLLWISPSLETLSIDGRKIKIL
ncbi:hypothetical protein CsatB_028002 [Cannabis sativa]